MAPEPLDLPAGLAAALRDHGAQVTWHRTEGPRTYVRAAGDEELFAWFTRDPREEPMVDREETIRRVVGTEGALRAPPLLARGSSWRLERFIRSDPLEGEAAIGLAVRAAERLAGLTLPDALPGASELRRHALGRRARVALSPLPLRDYLRARGLAMDSDLPRVTSHGDFHPAHLLLHDGALWVIDWDLTAQRPAGFDLMQLWVHLGAADRELLFEQAVAALGEEHRRDLARVRYVVLTQMIGACFAERHAINREPEVGRRWLELLPRVRDEAV